MAGHEWEDWFEREEFIGQISDIRVQNLQVERELVQKRTFTRWMNLHLEKCDPPVEVHDLFRDIQDGHVLMVLLEELSGCKLLHGFKKSSHRIFRLNNIAKVLSFLEERNVKLVSIDAADVADGNSSIILGLIWNIILFFQIKELTGNIRSQFPSSSSLSSIPTSSDSDASYCSTPSDERRSASTAMREHSKAIKKLLQWVQKRTRKYGVAVQDFGKSWTSGLAFLAVIKSIDPSLVDMRKALLRTAKENLEDGFRIAHYSLGIPRLLEPEDVSINTPDEQSIMTYVSQFLEHFPGIEEPEESCQLIERSVSMGRLNFRDSDAHQIRNNAHRSRVKERSYMFQRASDHPPPKILISSVSEDRSAMSPPFRPAAKRSWSTEDFLADPPDVEDVSSSSVVQEPRELPTKSTSYTHSPTSSSAPESVSAESVIGDSAISSPDSWVESEFGVKFCESRSDSSLCDSGTAWDVYRATPIEVTAVDEGFVQTDNRTPDETQSIAESYVDEGVYSLSSLESTQERIQVPSEKKQEEEGKEIQDMVRDHSKAEVTEEVDSKQMDSSQEPSSGLCDAEAGKSDHTSAEESTDSECLKKAEDFTEDAQDHEGQVNGQSNSEEFEVGNECLKESEETREEAGIVKERVEDEASKDDPRDLLDAQETLANTHPTDQDSQASNTSIGLNIPLISISSEPDEPEERQDPAEEDEGLDTDVKGDVETTSCLWSEDVKPAASEQTGGTESQLLDEHDSRDEAAIRESSDHIDTKRDSSSQLSEAVNPEQEVEFHQPDGDQNKLCDSETSSTQQNSTDPVNSEPNGLTGISRDSFYSDFDQNTDPVEPMDLFYPDKEESVFTEPPDTELQSWPSVLSVSALQPAPASETQPDQPLGLLGANFRSVVDPIQEDDETNQEPDEASDSQENSLLPREMMGVFWDVPADGSDLSSGSARENTEPVRSDFKSSNGQDGSQIPPVLRHRKGARFIQSTDSRTGGAAATREDDDADSDLWCSELHVLLLLWLLLYCFLLLPQMDLKTLPGLLLNLHH